MSDMQAYGSLEGILPLPSQLETLGIGHHDFIRSLLSNNTFRLAFCLARFEARKSHIRYFEGYSSDVIDYNAQFHPDAFGCGRRMDLLLNPLKGVLWPKYDSSILIAGPRTEDDIFLAKSLGLNNVRGCDLFSYSEFIDVVDLHSPPYEPESFDAIVLGWVLPYLRDPIFVFEQLRSLLREGGVIGLAWEDAGEQEIGGSRLNSIHAIHDVKNLLFKDADEILVQIDRKVSEYSYYHSLIVRVNR